MTSTALNYQDGERSLIISPLSTVYQDKEHVANLRHEFATNSYVKIPGLFSDGVFNILRAEVARLEGLAVVRDFIMQGYDTRRMMSTLGGLKILEESPLLAALYSHYDLRSLIREIVGAEIYPCQHPDEFIVINRLVTKGGTHGRHLDDPAFSLAMILESPPAEGGGLLEFVSRWREFCQQAQSSPDQRVEATVELARAANLVNTKYHCANEVYLLRADECLHRVTELTMEGSRRTMLNFAYQAMPETDYGATATKLYSEH